MKESRIVLCCWPIFIMLISCPASVSEKSEQRIHHIGSHKTIIPSSDTTISESNPMNKDTLTIMYVRAIKDFIGAVQRKDKITFDTLYFSNRKSGGADDFPDIELPKTINGVAIIVLSTVDMYTAQRYHYTNTSPMINLMGWLEKEKGEFIFVTFFPEFKHKYDCYIKYKSNSEKTEYEIETLTIEVLINDKNGKTDHYAIYQNEKYIGDRPIIQQKH